MTTLNSYRGNPLADRGADANRNAVSDCDRVATTVITTTTTYVLDTVTPLDMERTAIMYGR